MLTHKRSLLLLGLLLLLSSLVSAEEQVLSFSPSSVMVELNRTQTVQIKLSKLYDFAVSVNFTYGDESEVHNETNGMIAQLPTLHFAAEDNSSKAVSIDALKVGHLVVGAISSEIKIGFENILRIDIIHSFKIKTLSEIIGWIYFAAWSISFYPQVVLNFRLKSVEGLSLDFISLNFLGHSCYFVFNMALYWIPEIQHQYFQRHPRGVNPVQVTDVMFSMHAVLLTFITIVQCIVYRRTSSKVSVPTISILVVLVLFIAISGIVSVTSKLSYLEYIYFISYVKLTITVIKYIPQAWKNYKRKSTVGWSITNVLLDFTGGSFSLIQMFLLAYNFNDWSSIFGSPTKLGLSLLSIFFDVLFIFQHYVLYRHPAPESENYSPIA